MRRLRLCRGAAAALIALTAFLPTAGHAGTCLQAIDQAAILEGVPRDVLRAIGRVEAGIHHDGRIYIWPWSVNDHGKSLYFRSSDAALSHVRAQLDAGRTNIDIGCMQINWHWHRDSFGDPADAFDPLINARYAARYLRHLKRNRDSWAAAVGAYHSRQEDRSAAYKCRVAAALRPQAAVAGCE